jgi:predicted outer membrane repeat protein
VCYSVDSAAVVQGFTLTNATADYDAGGVYCNDSYLTFANCVIARNSCGQRGGGVYCESASPKFVNCTIEGNSAGYGQGGGIYCSNSSPSVENTIIAFNTSGEAVRCSGSSAPVLTCCDVYGNAGGDWVDCISGQDSLNGNFSADPILCMADSGDFHLDESSPCTAANQPLCGLVGALPAACTYAGVPGLRDEEDTVPLVFELARNQPNPFTGSTTIRYSVPRTAGVRIGVFDVRGRLVAPLIDSVHVPGRYQVRWSGRCGDAGRAAPGIYFVRMETREFSAIRKMILLR